MSSRQPCSACGGLEGGKVNGGGGECGGDGDCGGGEGNGEGGEGEGKSKLALVETPRPAIVAIGALVF